MPLKNLQKLAVIALFFVAAIPAAQAAAGSSANYTLDTAVISGGGGSGSSANYNLPKFVLGGDFEGSASSASYRLCSEFEYATESGCVAATPVTPPTPPPVTPPVTPPASSGGGGSGYIPPKELIIQPPIIPVIPPVTPPVTPSEPPPAVTPPTTQPGSGEQQPPADGQPTKEKPLSPVSPVATTAPGAPTVEGETRPIAILPVIPGMGETGYKEITEIPFFKLPVSKENVWCGKTSCAGVPVKLFKSAPVTRKLVSTSWQGWFMLSLVITGILFWVEWKINSEKPLPAAAKRKKRKK